MGNVVSFDDRIVRDLAPRLAEQLQAQGAVTAHESDLGVHPETWRRAVRAAGRALGRKVRSYHVRAVLHAELTDWPRDAEESAVAEQQLDDLADRLHQSWERAVRDRPTPIRPTV